MRVLNLYAGVGGNRLHWTEADVTAVELDPAIAEIYSHHFPKDEMIVGDAHEYLRDYVDDGWDLIWSSPPCQTHSRFILSGTNRKRRRYPDMRLYEEILWLQRYHSNNLLGSYVVENVIPYYGELIPAQRIGRHLFWTDLDLSGIEDVKRPPGFWKELTSVDGSKKVQEWLGMSWDKNVYYETNHDPSQIWRNAVHPEVGQSIYERMVSERD